MMPLLSIDRARTIQGTNAKTSPDPIGYQAQEKTFGLGRSIDSSKLCCFLEANVIFHGDAHMAR